MSNRPFRFVHAGDFHLELPPQGLAEIPDHLRELFVEAAYAAAERTFKTVLAEEADFLVLAGDLLHPGQTGPRGPLFLQEQFRRLAERDVDVYWAGGRVDPPDAWPAAIALPENVHVFPQGVVEQLTHQRDDVPLAQVIGVSRDRRRTIRTADFAPDPGGLFSIAVVHGNADPATLQSRGIHYWALGGRHGRNTLFSSPQVAHYPGSPQGRRAEEHGAHGCTLVQVDGQGNPHTSLVPTDAIRWLNERVVVDEETGRDDLETLLRERMHTLLENCPRIDLLISWTIAGTGPMPGRLRRGTLGDEMLGWLRSEYGYGPPAAWSASLDVEPSAAMPPEWYEQETIRGDYLRAIRQFQVNSDEPLDLEAYVAEAHVAGTLGPAVAVATEADRQRVLREAAWLGIDLLSGEESQS